MIYDVGWSGGQPAWFDPTPSTSERVVAAVRAARPAAPLPDVRRQRRERREVVAARAATGSAAAKPMGGKRPVLLAGQRAFILDRIEEVPNLSLRALAAELAERGVVVSYGAVWTFVHREGLSFKKKRASRRAGSA